MSPTDRMSVRVATVIVGVSYPVMVFLAFTYADTAAAGFLTLAVGAVRLAVLRRLDGLGVLLVCIGLAILVSDAVIAARLYPVAVNLAALGYFAWSLLRPPSAIERIARLSDPDLPESAVAYTRRVTMVWCAFFVVNGAIAAYTALWSSLETWVFYNGFVAYVLMGLLFAGEYLVRLQVRRSQVVHD